MNRKTYTLDITLVSDGEMPDNAEITDLVSDQMGGLLDDDGLECVAVLLKAARVSTFTERTNKARAAEAIDGLEPYAYNGGLIAEFNAASRRDPEATLEDSQESFLTVAGDFIADLFHAARDLGIYDADLISRAVIHFDAEVDEEEGGRD